MYYTVGKYAYYVEFKPANYALFDKDPMAFYDKMLRQEMLVVKAKGVPKKKQTDPDQVDFSEFTQKRHIGARVDAFNAAVDAANFRKLQQTCNSSDLHEETKQTLRAYSEQV